jgi:hypothetical protein
MMGKVTPRQHLRCRAPRHSLFPTGWVAERLKAAVLKTAVRGSVPWVRIPPHPPRDRHKRLLLFVSWLTTEVQSNLYPQRRFAWSVRGGRPSRGYPRLSVGSQPDPGPQAHRAAIDRLRQHSKPEAGSRESVAGRVLRCMLHRCPAIRSIT